MKKIYLHTANISFTMNDPLVFVHEKEQLSISELEFVIEQECKERFSAPSLFELEIINDLGFEELYSDLCGCVVQTTAKLISVYE